MRVGERWKLYFRGSTACSSLMTGGRDKNANENESVFKNANKVSIRDLESMEVIKGFKLPVILLWNVHESI